MAVAVCGIASKADFLADGKWLKHLFAVFGASAWAGIHPVYMLRRLHDDHVCCKPGTGRLCRFL